MMSQKKLGFFVRVVLALLLLIFICYRVLNTTFWDDLKEIRLMKNGLYLIVLAIVLMPFNWGLEAKKWQIAMKPLKQFTGLEALKSVLSGISTGMVTPNRIGNFIGRTYHLNKSIKTKATLLTFLTNLAQFVTTVVGGIIGLIFFGISLLELSPTWTYLIGLVLLIVSTFIYFYPSAVYFSSMDRWYPSQIKEGIFFVQNTRAQRKLAVLGLSGMRYMVFVLQFTLVLIAFDDTFSLFTLLSPVAVVYLIMTITPALFFGKLLVREGAALIVLGALGITSPVIIVTGFTVWLINLAIPSLIGGSFLFSKR